MATIAMPQLGESVAEGTIVRWLKRVGDPVRVDEPLFEVSTDKVNTEIPSLESGVLSEILVAEGETVPVGTVLARIGESDSHTPLRTNAAGPRSQLHSPVVRRLAREHSVDLSKINGTGGGGRVTRNDVLAYVAASLPAAAAPANGTTPMPLIRQQIAERVSASKRTAADVFSVIEADMELVVRVREEHKAAFERREGFALTYLPFIARATVDALAAFADLNARIDLEAKTITYNREIHLGIAVDLDEKGLLVPVIRDADAMNVLGIARRINALARSARNGTIAPADVTGPTFTITNNGAFGTLMTAPVINQPNVAILSTDLIEQRAAVVEGAIVARHRMYLCMTWDHRALDGSTAGRFLARIKNNLETWDWATQLA
jgi:pyruvate dehydrogenase E2 component (dihydrolipoamide acetyltransferase)